MAAFLGGLLQNAQAPVPASAAAPMVAQAPATVTAPPVVAMPVNTIQGNQLARPSAPQVGGAFPVGPQAFGNGILPNNMPGGSGSPSGF
jgi:hypothetical protein